MNEELLEKAAQQALDEAIGRGELAPTLLIVAVISAIMSGLLLKKAIDDDRNSHFFLIPSAVLFVAFMMCLVFGLGFYVEGERASRAPELFVTQKLRR